MRTVFLLVLASACTAPDYERMFNSVGVAVHSDAARANDVYVDAIRSAESTVHVALPQGEDTDVSDALIEAYLAGVEVEVIADIDQRTTPAVAALLDADVPVQLADGGIAYFDFNINADVSFASETTVMSHSWVVADRRQIVSGDRFGGAGDGTHVTYSVEGEELVEDILWEHNQVFGGIDATAVTAFDASAKSTTDPRWGYMVDQPLQLGVWFGPQERLLKRVVDAIYGARVSVRVLTDDFTNPELAKAIQDKAEWGIDTQVIVGPGWASDDPDRFRSAQRSQVEEAMPDVDFRQSTTGQRLPTIVLIDYEPDDVGKYSMVRAQVLTHPLLSASRLYRGNPVPSDQLIDGTMWTLEQTEEPGPDLLLLLDAFQAELDTSEEL